MPAKAARPPKNAKSTYAVHPGVAYCEAIITNMPDKTGRSIDEWKKLVLADGPKETKARKAWLQKTHKLGGTTAELIVHHTEGTERDHFDGKAYLDQAVRYVEAMYEGKKAPLRAIHDAALAYALTLGADVRVCPCKTIVPLYREHVFAEIKPATQKRVDLGLCLKGAKRKPTKRLVDTGGAAKGNRITHRIPLESVDDFDADAKDWLAYAYAIDG
ncbi:MAG: DUF5655 domain-containing protein [Phycisphaerales bacterium]